jgi:hypothetical protein
MLARLMIIAVLTLTVACSGFNRETPPEITNDGLQRVISPDFELFYVRPNIDFTRYNSIYVADLRVEFKRGWKASQNISDPNRVSDRDIERIKIILRAEFVKVFANEFAAGVGYTIVTQPGPNTLILSPEIINLYINSPQNSTGYQMTVLSENVGSMTIKLELSDASNKEVLLRISDPSQARDYGSFRQQETVQNQTESDRLLRIWAKSLSKTLSNSRSPG